MLLLHQQASLDLALRARHRPRCTFVGYSCCSSRLCNQALMEEPDELTDGNAPTAPTTSKSAAAATTTPTAEVAPEKPWRSQSVRRPRYHQQKTGPALAVGCSVCTKQLGGEGGSVKFGHYYGMSPLHTTPRSAQAHRPPVPCYKAPKISNTFGSRHLCSKSGPLFCNSCRCHLGRLSGTATHPSLMRRNDRSAVLFSLCTPLPARRLCPYICYSPPPLPICFLAVPLACSSPAPGLHAQLQRVPGLFRARNKAPPSASSKRCGITGAIMAPRRQQPSIL